MAKNNKSRFAISALIAAAAGYVAGVLTAPKSGKETRKEIKDTASKAKKQAEKRLKLLHSELDRLINQGQTKLQSLRGGAKKELTSLINKAQAAKDKTKGILSAFHEGESNDKDLQKAVKEAQKAQDHLKDYLNKQ